jgi:hypothetical protein
MPSKLPATRCVRGKSRLRARRSLAPVEHASLLLDIPTLACSRFWGLSIRSGGVLMGESIPLWGCLIDGQWRFVLSSLWLVIDQILALEIFRPHVCCCDPKLFLSTDFIVANPLMRRVTSYELAAVHARALPIFIVPLWRRELVLFHLRSLRLEIIVEFVVQSSFFSLLGGPTGAWSAHLRRLFSVELLSSSLECCPVVARLLQYPDAAF